PIFPEDCDLLRQTLEETEARLVLIDPLRAFLSGGSGQAVARGLDRIAQVAEETRANVTLVRHLNKGGRGQQAIYRGNHSIHIIGAARTAFLVGPHPVDEGVRVLACTKNNLVQAPPSLGFRIVSNAHGIPVIQWIGPVDVSSD